ncbi:hypothetical protein JXA02_07945 [candidate division KSB1 bacterium]|nr:hypothetical protein [candidate division KSB1 bacterium]RQW06036.1 MAG: hypothetical protein EH222_09275 [candidate division KSB1 bacterium]
MPTGLGFEVDKLSRNHTEAYIRDYLRPIAEALGPLYGTALRYVMLDSWEAGMQNWTDDMLAEFQRRRGYDARPFLPVLEKIAVLVEGGATVLGRKPIASPSLAGYPDVDAKIGALATALWGDLDGISRTRRTAGKGQVIWGLPLADVLASMQIAKDVEYSRTLDMDVHWIHRRTATADIYFVVNGSDRAADIDVRFRVTGKTPELWSPDTGERRPAAYKSADSLTTVPLTLSPYGSVLVVFQQRAADAESLRQDDFVTTRTILAGPWDVSFPANSGAPEKIQLAQLQSWTAHADSGVRYFSGTAAYVKTIDALADWFRGDTQVILDLGEVRDIAEVFVNGKAAGTGWKPPYLFDITRLLKPGANDCRIEVTNQWTNRLLGDHRAKAGQRVLAGSDGIRFFGPLPPVQESGLLGPVALISRPAN